MNRESFITVQGWMVTDLHLKGNDLLIYAIIYGFSQDERQKFSGSLQYLADWTNSTKQGVIKNLKSLLDRGYIEKTETFINGIKLCEYHATKFNRVLNKVEYPMQQSLTNNIEDNIEDNIDIKGPDAPVSLVQENPSLYSTNKPRRNYTAKPIIQMEEENKKLNRQQKKQLKIKDMLDIIPRQYSAELINVIGEYLDMRIDLHIGKVDVAWFEKEWEENIYPALLKYSEEDIIRCFRVTIIPKQYKRCFINISNYGKSAFNDTGRYSTTELTYAEQRGKIAVEQAKKDGTYRSEF